MTFREYRIIAEAEEIDTSVRLIKSLKKRRLWQAILAFLVIVGALTGAANASALLTGTGDRKTATGRLDAIGSRGRLTLKIPGGSKTEYAVHPDAPVFKDRQPVVLESLAVGDRLVVTYVPLLGGQSNVLEVRADSLVVNGRIISVDAKKSLVTIFDTANRSLEIQAQTVILRDGSLAGFADVVPGLTVRAELDDTEPSKLMRLKIDS